MTELLAIDANYEALRQIGPWLAELIGQDHAAFGGIELAVHELAANSVDHAESSDGQLRLDAAVEASEYLVVELRDRGVRFDPEDAPDPDPDTPQVGGYGLMIVEQLAHELRYERLAEENLWVAKFPL